MPPGAIWDALGALVHPDWRGSNFHEMIRETQEYWRTVEGPGQRRAVARRLRVACWWRATGIVSILLLIQVVISVVVAMVVAAF